MKKPQSSLRWAVMAFGFLLTVLSTVAGPYAPAAGLTGSDAIHRTDDRVVMWANRVVDYAVGADCLPQWQNGGNALGPATSDPSHITCLGAGGTITLSFPGFIQNGEGPDFVVFENAFLDNYLELAWIEVSKDGIQFVRFPSHSTGSGAVGSFGVIDPTTVKGLGCKYRQPYGEPYDLADLGLDQISHVRIVDIIGDGRNHDTDGNAIFDPYPNSQSAGFDLEAIGVLHASPWQTMTVATMKADRINATAFVHLSDGRFLLGAQGVLSIQKTWGAPALTAWAASGFEYDPSFIAVRSSASALLGAGGGFGGSTGVHPFDPTATGVPLRSSPLSSLQNFSGAWWHSPDSGREGWIIAGTNGPTGKNRLTYLSADGRITGALTQDLSSYSSGLAVDATGNIFAAQYELDSAPQAAESEIVRSFSVSKIDAVIEGGFVVPLSRDSGAVIHKFGSASSLAVDAMGRLWAGGFKTNHLEGFDPRNGAKKRFFPAALAGEVLYQVQTFSRLGEPYLAYLASDEAGTPGTAIVHGLAPLSTLTIPETYESWLAFRGRQGSLLDYALGTKRLEITVSTGRPILTFHRYTLRTDVNYVVETSSSLSARSWTTIAESVAGGPITAMSPFRLSIEEVPSCDLMQIQIHEIESVLSSERSFYRLRIVLASSIQP